MSGPPDFTASDTLRSGRPCDSWTPLQAKVGNSSAKCAVGRYRTRVDRRKSSLNQGVAGSIPARPTNRIDDLRVTGSWRRVQIGCSVGPILPHHTASQFVRQESDATLTDTCSSPAARICAPGAVRGRADMRPAVGIELRSPYELRIQGENLFGCRQTLQIGRVCPPGCHPRLDEPRVRPLLQEAGVRRYEPATRSRGVDFCLYIVSDGIGGPEPLVEQAAVGVTRRRGTAPSSRISMRAVSAPRIGRSPPAAPGCRTSRPSLRLAALSGRSADSVQTTYPLAARDAGFQVHLVSC